MKRTRSSGTMAVPVITTATLVLIPRPGVAVVILSNLSPNSRIPATVLGIKLMEELRD